MPTKPGKRRTRLRKRALPRVGGASDEERPPLPRPLEEYSPARKQRQAPRSEASSAKVRVFNPNVTNYKKQRPTKGVNCSAYDLRPGRLSLRPYASPAGPTACVDEPRPAHRRGTKRS